MSSLEQKIKKRLRTFGENPEYFKKLDLAIAGGLRRVVNDYKEFKGAGCRQTKQGKALLKEIRDTIAKYDFTDEELPWVASHLGLNWQQIVEQ